jgi:hypothetical protein
MVAIFTQANINGKTVLPFVPKIDSVAISNLLLEWKFTKTEIDKLILIFEFRNMIPEAAVSDELGAGYCFIIALRPDIFSSQEHANRCVVHELRHIYYTLKIRVGRKKLVCWEEHNCSRMEERYKHINFLTKP